MGYSLKSNEKGDNKGWLPKYFQKTIIKQFSK
jgi:hypothetical protein